VGIWKTGNLEATEEGRTAETLKREVAIEKSRFDRIVC
jgi:hypothetical protein